MEPTLTEHKFIHVETGDFVFPVWYQEYEIVRSTFRIEHCSADGDSLITFTHRIRML